MQRGPLKFCLQAALTISLFAGSFLFQAPDAEAAVCYDRYGRKFVVDAYALATPYNCYNSTGVVIIVRPLAPVHVGRPYYGAAGVRGTARRTTRRTSRRVHRRRH